MARIDECTRPSPVDQVFNLRSTVGASGGGDTSLAFSVLCAYYTVGVDSSTGHGAARNCRCSLSLTLECLFQFMIFPSLPSQLGSNTIATSYVWTPGHPYSTVQYSRKVDPSSRPTRTSWNLKTGTEYEFANSRKFLCSSLYGITILFLPDTLQLPTLSV